MNKRLYKAVIWDIDDTLLNTSYMVVTGRTQVIKTYWSQLPQAEAVARWNHFAQYVSSYNVINGLRMMLESYGFSADLQQLASAEDLFWKSYRQAIILRDGAVEALRTLSEQNIPQGIVTNGKPDLQWWKINETEISDWIPPEQIVVRRGKSAEAKPMPDGLLQCANLLNVAPTDCYYIGDRLTDVIAGNIAGMSTAKITVISDRKKGETAENPLETPTQYIDNPTDILPFILS